MSEDRKDEDFIEPLVEEPQELLPLATGALAAVPPDPTAAYIRNRPYEAVALAAAAGLTLGLFIGLRS